VPQVAKSHVETLSQIIREGRTPAFLISSVTPEQKTEYAAIIENIGGLSYYSQDCMTILLWVKPSTFGS